MTTVTFPSTLTETYSYDAVGNLTQRTDRKNQTISYTYDALDRLTRKAGGSRNPLWSGGWRTLQWA